MRKTLGTMNDLYVIYFKDDVFSPGVAGAEQVGDPQPVKKEELGAHARQAPATATSFCYATGPFICENKQWVPALPNQMKNMIYYIGGGESHAPLTRDQARKHQSALKIPDKAISTWKMMVRTRQGNWALFNVLCKVVNP
jgi:hypothetical protein